MAINIHTLTESDKDRLVVFQRGKGEATERDEGVITSWNKHFVFVRYKGDIGSKATYPDDLSFSLTLR